jgi:hypothetical protein
MHTMVWLCSSSPDVCQEVTFDAARYGERVSKVKNLVGNCVEITSPS